MKLNDRWTKVTPLSKFLALMMFVFLPFIGFYMGTKYQKSIALPSKCADKPKNEVKCPTSFCQSAEDFETDLTGVYSNEKDGYRVTLPEGWKAKLGPNLTIYSPGYVSNGPDIIQGAVITIEKFQSPYYGTLEELVKKVKEDELAKPIKSLFVTVDNVRAFQFEYLFEGYGRQTDIIKDKVDYGINIEYNYNQKNLAPYNEVYDKLLKSFEFITD